jgi:hypothetical protein
MPTAAEMSWDEINALVAELAVQSKETDRRFKETDRRLQEFEQRLQAIESQRLTTHQPGCVLSRPCAPSSRPDIESAGYFESQYHDFFAYTANDFIKEWVRPSVDTLFQAYGLTFHRSARSMKRYDDHGQLVGWLGFTAWGDETMMAFVCQLKPALKDVDDLLAKLANLKSHWPKYRDFRIKGTVAGQKIPEDVASYAQEQGLFVIAPSGETMRILNDDSFQPRVW